jgi:hypothetical protein
MLAEPCSVQSSVVITGCGFAHLVTPYQADHGHKRGRGVRALFHRGVRRDAASHQCPWATGDNGQKWGMLGPTG